VVEGENHFFAQSTELLQERRSLPKLKRRRQQPSDGKKEVGPVKEEGSGKKTGRGNVSSGNSAMASTFPGKRCDIARSRE